jgi:hypothetical protein
MLNGKGLAFSALGAVIAAGLWVVLIELSGWNLWVLAPAVGGAAGYGMMRATQMRGGFVPGAVAAACTVVAISGARYYVVGQWVEEQVQESAFEHVLESAAAAEEAAEGEVWDDDGEYTPAVHARAQAAWDAMTTPEREELIAAVRSEQGYEGALTGVGLLFDFGLFGLICTGLAAGTAFKTGSVTLERALEDKGVEAQEVAATAARLREEDRPSTGWRLPGPATLPENEAGRPTAPAVPKQTDAA